MWLILNGEIIQTESPRVKDTPFTKPYPLTLFTITDGVIESNIARKCQSRAVMQPYPLSYWIMSKYINEGYPYNGLFKGIEYVEPIERYDIIRLNENIRVVSPPHGLDKLFPVTKMEIPLDKPEDTKYTLNEVTKNSLTEVMAQTNMETFREIHSAPTLTTMLASAKRNATELIKSADGGYVTLRRNEQGIIEEILISDQADYMAAQNIWRWNKNGFGFSSTGYNGEYGTAITMDGAIVADKITSGTMYANRVKGGTLEMGGIDGVNGMIVVKGGDGSDRVVLSHLGAVIHGTIQNKNIDSGVELKLQNGRIESLELDELGKEKRLLAAIDTTSIYGDRTDPSISFMGDGFIIYSEWLGVAEHKDSIVWATTEKGNFTVVTDVRLKADGTLDVTKKDLIFMKGICLNSNLSPFNPGAS